LSGDVIYNNFIIVSFSQRQLLYKEYSQLPKGKRCGKIHFALKVERSLLEEAVSKI